MIVYFIIFSIIIIAVSRRLSSAWSQEPSFEPAVEEEIDGQEPLQFDTVSTKDAESGSAAALQSKYSSVTPVPDHKTSSLSTSPIEEESEEFDFDLRKAVLYSEIMAPKWKEYN